MVVVGVLVGVSVGVSVDVSVGVKVGVSVGVSVERGIAKAREEKTLSDIHKIPTKIKREDIFQKLSNEFFAGLTVDPINFSLKWPFFTEPAW